MQLFFADDSRQPNPSRIGMGPLIAIGGISVPDSMARHLEQNINAICIEYGFPEGEEFKWSPGRSLWMRRNLVEEKRERFFIDVLK